MREDGWDRYRDGGDGDGGDPDGVEQAGGGDEPDDEPETVAVRERLADEIDAERVHGFHVTRRNGETFYVVFSRSTTWDRVDDDVDMDIPVTDIRTAVVDLADDNVRVTDNGMWVPRGSDVAQGLAGQLARTGAEQADGWGADTDPLLGSSVDGVDADDLLDREVEPEREGVEGQDTDKMERHGGIDPSRPWGYGGGPPPEVSTTVSKLEDAGLDPEDHLSRLVWGKKEPMDRIGRPVAELTGNYGIELQDRDSGLVAIDVDYPEHFPEWELPDTFEVSSPHGDDSRRHIVFRCDDKKRLAREIGAWAVQGVDWGDLWIGDRYLVGPGSQLSEFGCDDGEHQRGEPGGCEACEDELHGFYRVVNDAPIATVSADAILSLLDVSSGWTLRNGPADRDPPESESDDDQDDADSPSTCDSCGATRDDDDLKTFEVGGSTRRVCRGGCDE